MFKKTTFQASLHLFISLFFLFLLFFSCFSHFVFPLIYYIIIPILSFFLPIFYMSYCSSFFPFSPPDSSFYFYSFLSFPYLFLISYRLFSYFYILSSLLFLPLYLISLLAIFLLSLSFHIVQIFSFFFLFYLLFLLVFFFFLH